MQIKNAILHIIKNDGNPSIYSETELDIDSEVCEAFITKHVKKLRNSTTAREATFQSTSVVYQKIQSYISHETGFKELSQMMAERFSEILNLHVDIPPADLMIVRYDVKHEQFLALFKLNYNECFTHKADGEGNSIVKCNAMLPFGSGKVEEACIIPFSPMIIQLIEKAHPVNGEAVNYFSEMFLECETSLSRKESAQIIDEVADEFIQEYFQRDAKTHALVKNAMTEEAEEADGILSMDNVAARVFEDPAIKQNFVHTMRDAGIIEDIPLGAKFVKQQFGTHRLKAENGIEVKFPAELADDEGQLEIEQHHDGSVTVVLKRLRVKG